MGEIGKDQKAKFRQLADAVAAEHDADILLLNSDLFSPTDYDLVTRICGRKRRKHVIVILTTNGGMAEAAYRIARSLQSKYTTFSVVIAGWCKSAGTVLCIGANKVIYGEHGELGPIDVQIRREDEIGERDSGLSVDAAFDSLSRATFKLFENFMLDIKEHSFGSITFMTAAEIASSMAVGLVAPIFAQLDPIKIGETYRSVRIAEEYARRLSIKSRNLRSKEGTPDAVEVLLRGYPTHGFVIDKQEALVLFEQVEELKGRLAELVGLLGELATSPVQGPPGAQQGTVEFLNAEQGKQAKRTGGGANARSGRKRGNGKDARANDNLTVRTAAE